MDGNLVERELFRSTATEPDALSGLWDTIKSVVKGSAAEGARAAAGTGAGLISAKFQGKGATQSEPPATKAPKGMYIALAVVAVLGLYAYSRSKKGKR